MGDFSVTGSRDLPAGDTGESAANRDLEVYHQQRRDTQRVVLHFMTERQRGTAWAREVLEILGLAERLPDHFTPSGGSPATGDWSGSPIDTAMPSPEPHGWVHRESAETGRKKR